jgi:hypothetical protein
MVEFIEHLDELGLLSCLTSIFVYNSIPNIIVDFCSHFHLLWFNPSHRDIFLVTVLEDEGRQSMLLGCQYLSTSIWSTFYYLCLEIYECLSSSFIVKYCVTILVSTTWIYSILVMPTSKSSLTSSSFDFPTILGCLIPCRPCYNGSPIF